jgi:hypothetical protein
MAFNLPLQNYFSRTTGPAVYSRPACWPVITDVATEVQFLFCDLGDAACQIRTTFTRTSGTQNITIDWGDGFTSTVTNTFSTDTTHTYTPGTGTPCPSLGYTTFKIRVYFTGTGVSVLNNCNIMAILNTASTAVGSPQICHVLEAYYGNSTQNATPVNFYSIIGSSCLSIYSNLQFVKLPATVSWTTWTTTFSYCFSLLKVVMPTSNSAVTSYASAFQNCWNLLEIILPSNSTGIQNMNASFIGCSNLRSVTLPTTMNSCTDLGNCFFNCTNLRSVTLPSINACNNLQFTFYTCMQLEWVKFTSMPTVGANMQNCFQDSVNLQTVYFPATVSNPLSLYSLNSAFNSCRQLKNIVLPSNMNVSTFESAFNSCTSLTSCILPATSPGCGAYNNIFLACVSLLKITLPAAPTAAVTFQSAFNGCIKLQEVTIPSGYILNNFNQTFLNCFSLKTISWTPGAQNSISGMQLTFVNCYLLTSFTMPTSMNALTTLSSAFSGARSLSSLTFPSSLNAVTTMANCFSGNTGLTSVTLPTSMSACTNFSGTFNSCILLTNITLPNTVGAVTTFNGCFSGCNSLKTCVLPGAAQLSLVNDINAMIQGCSDLVTLTNFDKIGSLTATPLMSAATFNSNRFKGGSAISFYGPLSLLQLNGLNVKTDTQAVRLLNTSAGQWTGGSPQINVSFTNMSTAQIVQLFNDMALQGTQATTKTINITGATGAAALTTADRLIVTSKNWTIIG